MLAGRNWSGKHPDELTGNPFTADMLVDMMAVEWVQLERTII